MDTGLSTQADRSGFVAAYLILDHYNGDALRRGPGPPFPDMKFLKDVIFEVRAKENIDPTRVYVVGGSSGGIFAYRAGCDLAEHVAAIASVAGVDVVPGCRPKRPISVLEIHGTADTAVPYEGRPGLYMSTAETIAKWRSVDGCAATPTVSVSTNVRDETWSRCTAHTAVELITLAGAAHGWHKSRYATTQTVWRFLAARPMMVSATLLKTRVLYTPARRIVTRMKLGHAASVQMLLLRGEQTRASRKPTITPAGTPKLTLSVPRSVTRGSYTFRVIVKDGEAQRVINRRIRLVR